MAVEFQKLLAERVCLNQGSGGDQTTWLQVKLSGRGLGDDQMIRLGLFLEDLLSAALGPDKAANVETSETFVEINANIELAENSIGSSGLVVVIDKLEKFRVTCKTLKLFKNKIGDEGGIRLARLIESQRSPVEELHLSHNVLTQRSLVALCMAIGKNEAYPLLSRSRVYIPCWLRMEYNNISKPVEVVEALRRDGDVPICTADNRDECNPWRCTFAGKTQRGVPKVHLYTIAVQSRSHRPSVQDDAELREEIRKWGGRAAPVIAGPAIRVPVASRQLSGDAGAATGPSPLRSGASPKGWGSPTHAWGSPSPVAAIAPKVEKSLEAMTVPPVGDTKSTEVVTSCGATCVESNVTPMSKTSATPPTAPKAQPVVAITSPSPQAPLGKSSERSSLLLDTNNRRRIAPQQLEAIDGSSNFVCVLCSFVMEKPVMTACSHLFCDVCFRAYVAEQVQKQKSQGVAVAVPLLPCPQPDCAKQLRKQDITSLDSQQTKVGAGALLQRLRNNLRVQCIHHTDLHNNSFGRDAAEIASSKRVTCSWAGELTAYQEHLCKCSVEKLLAGDSEHAQGKGNAAWHAESLKNGTEGTHREGTPMKAASPKLANASTASGMSDSTSATAAAKDDADGDSGEIRIARYDYKPKSSDKAQLAFKAHDLIRVFEVTPTGWAAGVRVGKQTHEEIGDAGWFPVAYLCAADTGVD